MNYNLAQPFYGSAQTYPDRLAISANGAELLYRDVLRQVAAVTGWLYSHGTKPKRVGILGSRSAETCVGILASAWIGAAYVPINLALPPAAIVDILRGSGLDAVIADHEGSRLLSAEVLAACPPMVLAWKTDVPCTSTECVTHYGSLSSPAVISEPAHMDRDEPGYVMYTSGTTGVPKGVVVPVGGVEHLLRVMDSKYALRPEDRVAETAAATFDISVYNMFATWRAGASLHIVSSKEMMLPSRYIKDHQLTIWFSVPSVATLMARMKLLKPGAFPSLRMTFFCGEPLLGSVASKWQQAAPSSTVVNMYGPTEATVMCTGEEFAPSCPMTRDIMAIGHPFAGMKAAVATPKLDWVANGTRGELLLAGPQLAIGYLDDLEKTASKFVHIDGERWYRTGDLALQDENGVFHYLGRADNQVKIRGYRVELEDIESHMRAITGCDAVAAVAWPVRDGIAFGIVAFVAGCQKDAFEVKKGLKEHLPSYMVPAHIHLLDHLPTNENGKIDRNALAALAASSETSPFD